MQSSVNICGMAVATCKNAEYHLKTSLISGANPTLDIVSAFKNPYHLNSIPNIP